MAAYEHDGKMHTLVCNTALWHDDRLGMDMCFSPTGRGTYMYSFPDWAITYTPELAESGISVQLVTSILWWLVAYQFPFPIRAVDECLGENVSEQCCDCTLSTHMNPMF